MLKATFFWAKTNKQNFLLKLDDEPTKTGIAIKYRSGDADLFVVQTGLKEEKGSPTILIGENTDLLVLTLHNFTNKKVFTPQMYQNRAYNQQKFGILILQGKFRMWHNNNIQWESQLFYKNIEKVISFRSWVPFPFSFLFFIFESSARKNGIIDAGEQITLSITDTTKKRRQWISRILPSATRSLEESLSTNLSHLYPPQMLMQNTQKRS